ncbi:Rpp14/Pop5 family-domain-containing protein [Lineolata rhizophorae]|uniref:Rpp14/Pop5 family-domain-containing protein n=1 Tax=Lineolata rhizophorae TaxID=578093 RepID=A0A6A6P5M3_9PEZI|nr:Rpp14/Pop5 family-domain-containing protein [Lineolata rhizophorae]
MVRVKHRYLLVNILYPKRSTRSKNAAGESHQQQPDVLRFLQPSPDTLTSLLLLRAIRESIVENFGDYGAGITSASLRVMYLSAPTSTAIIRVSRAAYRLLWASLSFMTTLPYPVSEACVLRVVRVSGTIRKAEEEAIRRARAAVLRARREAEEGKGKGSGGDGSGGILEMFREKGKGPTRVESIVDGSNEEDDGEEEDDSELMDDDD